MAERIATCIESQAGVLERISARMAERVDAPRILAIFAHPDDEVLALGGRLGRFGQSQFLCVTDGAPENGIDARAHGFATLEAYRESRRIELEQAFKLAGLPTCCARPLVVEQPSGSKKMVVDQTAAFHLVAITRQIARVTTEFRPEAILTHPYEGGHPDHDSCAFAVHAAVRLVYRTFAIPIVEVPFYHAGSNGLVAGCFLPGMNTGDFPTRSVIVCELSPEEQQRKRELLGCFVSQRETLALFGIEQEQFRIAPDYDFTRAPHEGRLLYEHYDWGVTGEHFRELAGAAMDELGLAMRGVQA